MIGEVRRVPVRWRCRVCGRDKFDRNYQRHNCINGYTKRFRHSMQRLGLTGHPFEPVEWRLLVEGKD